MWGPESRWNNGCRKRHLILLKKSGVEFASAQAGVEHCCPSVGVGCGPTCQGRAIGCGTAVERNVTEPRLEASLTGTWQGNAELGLWWVCWSVKGPASCLWQPKGAGSLG